jgi:hypothetical protein
LEGRGQLVEGVQVIQVSAASVSPALVLRRNALFLALALVAAPVPRTRKGIAGGRE